MIARLSLIPAALLAAAPAFAGGFSPAISTPAPVAAPVAIAPATTVTVSQSGDWTGAYVGGDLSYGRVNSDDFEDEANGYLTGLHAGYQRDFGRFVLGAEIEHDWGNVEFDDTDTSIDRVLRAKVRAGYDAGRFLPYATAGYARASLSEAVDDSVDGHFYGGGVEVMLNDRLSTGVEFLHHEFDDIGPAEVSANLNTVAIRGTIRF